MFETDPTKFDKRVIATIRAIRNIESGNAGDPESFDYKVVGDKMLAKPSNGAYQFQPDTWNAYIKKYNLPANFDRNSGYNQDLMALNAVRDMYNSKDTNTGKPYTVANVLAEWNAGRGNAGDGTWQTHKGYYYTDKGVRVDYDTPAYVAKGLKSMEYHVNNFDKVSQNLTKGTQQAANEALAQRQGQTTKTNQMASVAGIDGTTPMTTTSTEPGLGQKLIQGIAGSIPRAGVSAYNIGSVAAKGLLEGGNIVGSKILGLDNTPIYSKEQAITDLGKSRDLSSIGLGTVAPQTPVDTTQSPLAPQNVKAMSEAGGTGLQMASMLPVGKALQAGGKGLVSLKDLGMRGVAKNIVKPMAIEGGIGGTLYGAGSELQKTENPLSAQGAMNVGVSALGGGAIGALATPILGVAGYGLRGVGTAGMRKFKDIIGRTDEQKALEVLTRETGIPFNKYSTIKEVPTDYIMTAIANTRQEIADMLNTSKTALSETKKETIDTVLRPQQVQESLNAGKTAEEIARETESSDMAISFIADAFSKTEKSATQRGNRIDTTYISKKIEDRAGKIAEETNKAVRNLTQQGISTDTNTVLNGATKYIESSILNTQEKRAVIEALNSIVLSEAKGGRINMQALDNMREVSNEVFDERDTARNLAKKILGNVSRDLTDNADSPLVANLTATQREVMEGYKVGRQLYGAAKDAIKLAKVMDNLTPEGRNRLISMAGGILATGGTYNPVLYIGGDVLATKINEAVAKNSIKKTVGGISKPIYNRATESAESKLQRAGVGVTEKPTKTFAQMMKEMGATSKTPKKKVDIKPKAKVNKVDKTKVVRKLGGFEPKPLPTIQID